MNKLQDYILEKLKINSSTKISKQDYKYYPLTRGELIDIVEKRIKEDDDNIDFNDIDTSSIDDMEGIFAYKSQLTHIDISEWDVSNVTCMMEMFAGCKNLESIGDISNWKIDKLIDVTGMFYGCDKLTNTGDLDKWNSSKIRLKQNAFSLVNEKIIPKWA